MMIHINLLPKNLRKTERRSTVNFPYQIYLVTAFAILFLIHFCLLSVAAVKKIQLVSLEMRWQHMGPQSKEGVSLKGQIKASESNVKTLGSVMTRKIDFTEFLSGLGEMVPAGMWLERFSLTKDGLVIQGSVISLSQGEMTIIGRFLQDFRAHKAVVAAFSKVDLNSVQRRTIKTYDVVDFLIQGTFKA